MYDYNILVSNRWGEFWEATREIRHVLSQLGDEAPVVKGTLARGIIGVRTSLDPREIVREIRKRCEDDPLFLKHTIKWTPIDIWTDSEMEPMKEGVKKLRDKIGKGEKWGMKVKKRRYNLYHSIEIIEELAELIDEKVDLGNPDKILRVEIIGKNAGLSVLKPGEIFSTQKGVP